MFLSLLLLEKNVFFIIFNGESYDYIGSQRLVYDIINKKFPMEKDVNIKNEVPQLNMEDISLVVEVGQINKGGSLYMHHLKNAHDQQVASEDVLYFTNTDLIFEYSDNT